jgi:hypothetical protein
MQTKLKMALCASVVMLAGFPALAVDMPVDGTKNFSAPNDAPSYFSNETVPEPARINHPATFDSQDLGADTAADERSVSPIRTETRRFATHSSSHRSRHGFFRSQGHGGSTRFARLAWSRPDRIGVPHGGSRPASVTRAAARGGPQTGATRTNPTKHARTGSRQHAAVGPPSVLMQPTFA